MLGARQVAAAVATLEAAGDDTPAWLREKKEPLRRPAPAASAPPRPKKAKPPRPPPTARKGDGEGWLWIVGAAVLAYALR